MSKRKAPAYQMYAQDFNAGTIDMSLAERGLYITLLNVEWDRGGLPNDHKKLARLAGCSIDEFNEAWPEVEEKFTEGSDGLLRNSRLESVRKDRSDFIKGKSEAGKKGAAKRWGKATEPPDDGTANGKTMAQPMAKPWQNDGTANGKAMAQPSVCQWQNDSPPVSGLLSSVSGLKTSSSEGESEGEGSLRDRVSPSAGDDGSSKLSPSSNGFQPDPESEVVFEFECKRSSSDEAPAVYSVSRELFRKHTSAYPDLNVLAQYKRMDAWLSSSPANRKTKNGMGRFITNWLGRAKPEPNAPQAPPRPREEPQHIKDRRARIAASLAEMEERYPSNGGRSVH